MFARDIRNYEYSEYITQFYKTLYASVSYYWLKCLCLSTVFLQINLVFGTIDVFNIKVVSFL